MINLYNADVVHIGYPKAASTFLRVYLSNHPQVDLVHQQAEELLCQPWPGFNIIEKPNKDRVLILSDEYIAASVCVTGDASVWRKHQYHPGAFNLVRYDVVLDPEIAASRIHSRLPNAKILIVIRDQVSWFESLYRYSVSSLPPGRRSFEDYWTCPQGVAMRNAGYFETTIRAYKALFSDVLVMRCEKFRSSELCEWLGISNKPFPCKRLNEGHSGIALVHKAIPGLSNWPLGVKHVLKPFVKLLPGKTRPMLTEGERDEIHRLYANV